MHIIEVVLDGFKSYAKRTVISGFDREFNAITGLNGTGKSNILDSICFVLGISNLTQVRASNLNELIYKQGQAGVTKASVTLVFDNSDPDMSPHGYEQLSQITVTRQIAVGGRNKYMINGHTAQLQRVQNLFHSVQLNVNNPHFLIMQGRITKVLNMKPIEILGMIEEAAGTRMFETKKRKAIETIEKKETKLDEINRVMKEDITPRLEKLSTQRSQYLEYTTLTTDVESVGRLVQAYEFVCAEEAQKRCAEEQAKDASQRDEIAERLASSEQEDAQLKKQLTDTLARKEKEGAGELKKCDELKQELSKQLVKLNAEHTQLRKAFETDAAAAKANEAEAAKIATSQEQAQADLDKAQAAAAKAAEASTAAAASAVEKQSQYEAAMGLGASSGEGAKNLQAQLSEASSEVSMQETELKTADMRKKHLGKEIKDTEKKLAEARKSGGKQEKEHAALAAEVASLRQQMDALQYDEGADAELSRQLQDLQRAGSTFGKQERELASQVGGVDFKYTDPAAKFDRSRVKGTVAANMRVRDATHNTALEALAGGRLYQVVVDDEDTGMLLLTKGNLQRRVTLIPLSKIRPQVLPADKVAAAKKLVGANKAFLAVDLLDFAPEVKKAMQHVFGSALVCTDKEAARRVCDELRLKTVTLEGDLYDPSGTLTGGSRPKAGASMLHRLGLLNEVRTKLQGHQAEVGDLEKRVEACRKQGEQFGKVKEALELKQHELGIRADTMRASPVGQLATSLEGLQTQLSEADATASGAKAALEATSKRKADLASQLKDFEGNREERMAQSKKAIAEANKEARSKERALQTARTAEQKASAQLEELAKELAAAHEQRDELAQRHEQSVTEIEAKAAAEQKKRDEHEAAEAALAKCMKAVGRYDAEAAEISARREELETAREDGKVELNKIELRCARYEKELATAEATCKELMRRQPWMAAEKHQFGQPGTEYDFAKRKPAALQKELAKKTAQLEALSKRINKKVLTMLETAEQEYADLMSKKDIVEKDKDKIEAVIGELAQKKIEALQKTWGKVNADFGSIFSTLLPGAKAKLEPQEGCPVEEGLIVKVGFGKVGGSTCVWKQSLLELSGGQRSLIALSLVLSLLRFKPAPVYILDEVDAALDLSHTQNIGKMIKAHFTQSQFLVVSLKEGMFNNANVIFRTKFVDNVSCVTRTVPNGATPSEAPAADAGKKAKGGAAAGRAALTSKN